MEVLRLVGVVEEEDHQNHLALAEEEGAEVLILLEAGEVGEEEVHRLQVAVVEEEVLLHQVEVVGEVVWLHLEGVEEEEWKHYCFDFPHYVF